MAPVIADTGGWSKNLSIKSTLTHELRSEGIGGADDDRIIRLTTGACGAVADPRRPAARCGPADATADDHGSLIRRQMGNRLLPECRQKASQA
jgi:hypothetical protein